MTAIDAPTPAALPVPGLEPWWWPLIGRTRRRLARGYRDQLAAMFPHVRYGPAARVYVTITVGRHLGRRRHDAVRRWVAAAVVASAEGNSGAAVPYADLDPRQVGVDIDYDPFASRRWGDAVVHIRWRNNSVIR